MPSLQEKIETYFDNISNISNESDSSIKYDIESVIKSLDSGKIRVAEKVDGEWKINEWIKKGILLYFRIMKSEEISTTLSSYFSRGTMRCIDTMQDSHAFCLSWFDKIPLKFSHWSSKNFQKAEVRVVPGTIVRYGSFISKKSILMPCFINIGANIGSETMIDTWSTIGSCAQIGSRCHISGGVGIGGILEPLGARPTIIEDNCFIGARSEIAEGVIIEEGSVIGMGVFLSASTKIVNKESGEIMYGRVPKGSVVISGSMPTINGLNQYCAIIIKTVDEKTKQKTSINDLLRD